MYERMLDKNREPSPQEIRKYLGAEAYRHLLALEEHLRARYELTAQLRFPFGNNYGWGYKYSHRTFHLCYAFFEKEAFTVMVQVGDKQVPALEQRLKALSAESQEAWLHSYPCGEKGGWVRLRIRENSDLQQVLTFIEAKKPPKLGR